MPYTVFNMFCFTSKSKQTSQLVSSILEALGWNTGLCTCVVHSHYIGYCTAKHLVFHILYSQVGWPRPTMPFTDLAPLMQNPPNTHLDQRCVLWEVYSPPRVCPLVRDLGYRARRSIDTKSFWDLNLPDIQHALLNDLFSLRPFFTLLCPPCTYMSPLMFSNWNRMDVEKRFLTMYSGVK